MVYKLKYDSVHGIFPGELSFDDNAIYVCGKRIVTFREKEPQDIDWASTGAEYIIESTGKFTTAEKCMGHFNSPSSPLRPRMTAPCSSWVSTIRNMILPR